MKSLLILFMPLLIVVTFFSTVHFTALNYQVLSFFVYLGFWVSLSLWIAALSTKKWTEG